MNDKLNIDDLLILNYPVAKVVRPFSMHAQLDELIASLDDHLPISKLSSFRTLSTVSMDDELIMCIMVVFPVVQIDYNL